MMRCKTMQSLAIPAVDIAKCGIADANSTDQHAANTAQDAGELLMT
jgi:hypothetical protein